MKTSEMIAVLVALDKRLPIQCKAKEQVDCWTDCHHEDCDFQEWDYRVKPQPREWWIHLAEYPDTEFEADRILNYKPANPRWIHVREVIEEP